MGKDGLENEVQTSIRRRVKQLLKDDASEDKRGAREKATKFIQTLSLDEKDTQNYTKIVDEMITEAKKTHKAQKILKDIHSRDRFDNSWLLKGLAGAILKSKQVFSKSPSGSTDTYKAYQSHKRTLDFVANYALPAALLTAAGAILYYLAPYFDDDEYDDDDRSTSDWDPETDPEVRRAHAHPFVRLAQRGAKTRTKLRKHFRKHPIFTLGFTTAALFTAYAYRTHTRNKQLAQLLLGLADAPADRVHLTSYAGESCADTGECLRRVDPALHEVFVKYDAPDAAHALAKVYYHVVRVQHKRQQAVFVSDRAVLNAHLIRTDGTFRDSLGEIARAIAYHWKASNLLSIGWTRVKRSLRLGRKRKTVRRRSGSEEASTRKKMRVAG